jgi:MFS family permease
LSADWFIKKAGNVNLLILALLAYLVRFVGYSLLTSPFWCLPFEAMEAITNHLMWCAAATYCQMLVPEALTATMLGLLSGLNHGLGRVTGSMIGSTLIALFNARLTFRIIGIFGAVFALIYGLLYYSWLRKDELMMIEAKNQVITTDVNKVEQVEVDTDDTKLTRTTII